TTVQRELLIQLKGPPMNQSEALAIIDDALAKISKLRLSTPSSPAHIEFIQTTGLELARIFGQESPVSKNFGAIDYQSVGSFVGSVLDFDAEIARRRIGAYLRGLDIAEGILLSARDQLTKHGVDRILAASRIRADGARIF